MKGVGPTLIQDFEPLSTLEDHNSTSEESRDLSRVHWIGNSILGMFGNFFLACFPMNPSYLVVPKKTSEVE